MNEKYKIKSRSVDGKWESHYIEPVRAGIGAITFTGEDVSVNPSIKFDSKEEADRACLEILKEKGIEEKNIYTY